MFVILYPSSLSFCQWLPPFPCTKASSLSVSTQSPFTVFVSYYHPPHHCSSFSLNTVVHFYSPGLCISPGYLFTSEDLKLGSTNKKETATYIFLCLGYFISTLSSSSIHFPSNIMISFFFYSGMTGAAKYPQQCNQGTFICNVTHSCPIELKMLSTGGNSCLEI